MKEMKGKFKFIAVDRASEILGYTKFGKLYETDENGVIVLEDGNRIVTCGNYEKFDRGVYIYCEKHIKVNEEHEILKAMHVADMKHGDMVTIGDTPIEYEFLCFGRDEVVIRSGDFYTTMCPLYIAGAISE